MSRPGHRRLAVSLGRGLASCKGERGHDRQDHDPRRQLSDRGDPYGIPGMAGNVWEWVQDWLSPYEQGVLHNPTGPSSGKLRVLRGGSWFDGPWELRSVKRYWLSPADRFRIVGFRCAQGVD